ncbi:MAG: sulfotransferase domain-containing protein [Acidimicrobiia bacterium]
MPTLEPPLPTFLIIGAQKSATRWLRYNLGLHPEIFTPRRELSFFNSSAFRQQGTDWYRAQFEGWAGEPIVGEATPGYMIWRHRPQRVARRIKETIPDVRLIAILRDPVERANSAMVHHIKRGRLSSRSRLVEVVSQKPPDEDRMGLVAGGWYAASLRPFMQLFGDQVLVLLHDDVRDDPRAVYERALLHLGATTDFVPAELHNVVFSNQQGESPGSRRDVAPEERAHLFEYFRKDVRRLERMLGRDLSIWKPTRDLAEETTGDGPSIPRPAEHFSIAVAWIEAIIDAAAPEQFGQRNGAASVAARLTFEQLVADTYFSPEALTRHVFPNRKSLADGNGQDGLGGEPEAAYRRAADTLHTALAEPENLTGHVLAPLRDLPAPVYAAFAVTKHVVGGWDLAIALGQRASPPAELVEVVHPAAQQLALQEYLLEQRAPTGPGGGESTDRMRRFVESLDAARE